MTIAQILINILLICVEDKIPQLEPVCELSEALGSCCCMRCEAGLQEMQRLPCTAWRRCWGLKGGETTEVWNVHTAPGHLLLREKWAFTRSHRFLLYMFEEPTGNRVFSGFPNNQMKLTVKSLLIKNNQLSQSQGPSGISAYLIRREGWGVQGHPRPGLGQPARPESLFPKKGKTGLAAQLQKCLPSVTKP